MQIVFFVCLFVVGACFGSFLCCQARRMHMRATGKKSLGARSVCLNCKRQLKWYDNIPVLSWLILKGKCRKCGKRIGKAEILSEIGMGLAFLMIGTTININERISIGWLLFVLLLVFMIVIGFLAIYDGLYGELPLKYLIVSVIIAAVIVFLKEWRMISSGVLNVGALLDPLWSFLILGGLYWMLYMVSRGKWVGDGDWILATVIALVLFEPWLALVELFVANFLACIIMAPRAKKKKYFKVYFGPFLVIAFVLVVTFAEFLQSML